MYPPHTHTHTHTHTQLLSGEYHIKQCDCIVFHDSNIPMDVKNEMKLIDLKETGN